MSTKKKKEKSNLVRRFVVSVRQKRKQYTPLPPPPPPPAMITPLVIQTKRRVRRETRVYAYEKPASSRRESVRRACTRLGPGARGRNRKKETTASERRNQFALARPRRAECRFLSSKLSPSTRRVRMPRAKPYQCCVSQPGVVRTLNRRRERKRHLRPDAGPGRTPDGETVIRTVCHGSLLRPRPSTRPFRGRPGNLFGVGIHGAARGRRSVCGSRAFCRRTRRFF